MDLFPSLALCALFTIALLQAIRWFSGGSGRILGKLLPPGPTPLPIIGNLFNLGDQPHKSLAKLANTYGPLMTLQLGRISTVVISSGPLAKEVLQKHDINFSNRTVIDALYDQHGLPWLPVGPKWRNLRKICNSYIFTTQKLDANQPLRLSKVQDLLAHVQECCITGQAVDIGQAAFRTTLGALSNTIFSSNWDSDEVNEFKKVVRGIMDEAGKPNLGDYFPLIRKFDLQGIRGRMGIHFQQVLDTFDKVINERLQSRKTEGYVSFNDMLDTLLIISEKNSEEMDAKCMKHLFLAIIKETLRLHPAVPLLLPRKAGADVEISGYTTVPKGAQVLVNAWAIGRDPSLWEDPNCFMPERFLESAIDVRGQNFGLIPFGGGRRICPGLPLAMRMLQMMLGSLIHAYNWKLEDGVCPENMDMKEKIGLTLQKAQPLKAVPIEAIQL